jgi:hypothetical protein
MMPHSAVVVWQLRGFVEDVQCYFLPRAASLALYVERAGELLLREEFGDLRALMDRALELRRRLVAIGFRAVGEAPVDAHPTLESMLRHFVRDGTAALHPGPAA